MEFASQERILVDFEGRRKSSGRKVVRHFEAGQAPRQWTRSTPSFIANFIVSPAWIVVIRMR